MVFAYVDGPTKFKLDLLGGKRRLGETALQCALRKVEAESSLVLDKEWVANRVGKKFGGTCRGPGTIKVVAPGGRQSSNAFFVTTPPP